MEKKQKLHIETYGCQMNFADSEVVASIMETNNYEITDDVNLADVILINTCSVREHAEQRVLNRLTQFHHLKKKNKKLLVGIIGCMAERLKTKLLERDKIIDIIAGPDSYRNINHLINDAISGSKGINVELSDYETYDNISPLRLGNNNVSAFVSIMRGCENFCSYCVVPYTRGKERSRKPETILTEVKKLIDNGYKEVVLLGQNVNSYKFENTNFAGLIKHVANIDPMLRVRFAVSHPKDLSEELIETIVNNPNICHAIHLPIQSGSNRILELMNRKHNTDWYLSKIELIRKHLPDCAISTDIISGFCTETEQDHQDTISLMRQVGYDYAYMFKYSEREGTTASKKYKDDVPEETKLRRLQEMIDLQQELSHKSNLKDINTVTEVLAESISKRSEKRLSGRNSQNKVVIFDAQDNKVGDYVKVKIDSCSTATLFGKIVNK